MATDEKRQAVAMLAELLRNSTAMAVADYRGLSVSDMQTVRRTLRENGVQLRIAKNRLLKIAADEAELADLKPMLTGPTALAFVTGDEVALARGVSEAFRPHARVVTIKGGLLSGRAIDAAALSRLASLPGRETLLGMLANGIAGPMTGLAGALAGNIRNLAGALSALADQKRESEGAA